MNFFKKIIFILFLSSSIPAFSHEPEICNLVRFSDTGWTDISVTTALTSKILNILGYKTKNYLLSVPVTYFALSTGDVDVFLGYWNPSMIKDLQPYEKNHTVETVRLNLVGAKYTLAVPKFLYDAGLKNIKDISNFSEKLNFSIYGLEPGNDGNRVILSMIEKGSYNLQKFHLIESSEQAMLSEVESHIVEKKPIVFLGWDPHPMNSRFKISYLSGGDQFFGSNYGEATVGTNVRKGYLQECPNVGKLLKNLRFSVEMENKIMEKVVFERKDPQEAAISWLKSNIFILDTWLDGVKTWSDKDGTKFVKNFLSN